MQSFISSPKFITIAIALIALVAIPLTIIQVQNQQNIQQEADDTGTLWLTDQSASTSCPTNGSGVEITVTFTNTEPRRSSTDMDVIATDQQTGEEVDMGSIRGGETKSAVIKTGRETLDSGSVKFFLTWTDGHRGTDSRTARYKAVSKCVQPSPSPTDAPSSTPAPSDQPSPTPTICPTLGPVQNVRIECPNCP